MEKNLFKDARYLRILSEIKGTAPPGPSSASPAGSSSDAEDEGRREPHDIGQIAYKAATRATGCEQPWEDANQDKWTAAARAVLEWACQQMEQEAEYSCPCNEDERLTWENANLLRELGGTVIRR